MKTGTPGAASLILMSLIISFLSYESPLSRQRQHFPKMNWIDLTIHPSSCVKPPRYLLGHIHAC